MFSTVVAELRSELRTTHAVATFICIWRRSAVEFQLDSTMQIPIRGAEGNRKMSKVFCPNMRFNFQISKSWLRKI